MNSEGIGRRKMNEALNLLPNYLKLLYRLAKDNRVAAVEKALLLATAAYVVSPVDFLPDFIPFVGQIDDVLLIALILKRFMNSVERHILYEHWDGSVNLLKSIEQVLSWARFFIPAAVYDKVVNKSRENPTDTIDIEYEVR